MTLKTLILSLFTLTTLNCMDTNTRQKRIKRDSPPEYFFEGKDLEMAQAIYKGDIVAIESLIKNKHFEVNKRGNKLKQGNKGSIRYTYLGYAVQVGEVKAAEKLLELGADPDLINDEGALWANINIACDFKNKEMIHLLVKYKENLNPALTRSPLGDLLMGDNVDKELLELLLANGANINHQGYIGGDTAIIKALNTNKFDYVNYFLDKGADPTLFDSSGNNLASLVQDEINEGRLSDYGLKEYNNLKKRLTNEFKVEFPVKSDVKKGVAMAIARYENLSQADKDFVGKDEADRIKTMKDELEEALKKESTSQR